MEGIHEFGGRLLFLRRSKDCTCNFLAFAKHLNTYGR